MLSVANVELQCDFSISGGSLHKHRESIGSHRQGSFMRVTATTRRSWRTPQVTAALPVVTGREGSVVVIPDGACPAHSRGRGHGRYSGSRCSAAVDWVDRRCILQDQ